MVISQTPYRVSFAGGGTDLPAFYRHEPGAVLSATITRHLYVTVSPRFEATTRIAYTRIEVASAIGDIQHTIAREVLRSMGLGRHVEITTIGDLPSGTGLGSSSSLTVGLLNALNAYRGRIVSHAGLAAEACRVELDVLGKPVGKQDQYAAAFGGLNYIRFNEDESVEVEPVPCKPETRDELERRILLFYTGEQRDADPILERQSAGTAARMPVLRRMRDLADRMRHVLAGDGDLDEFAELLHAGWQLKRSLGFGIATAKTDGWYATARRAGAQGGKLLGAGGGGFLLLMAPPDRHEWIRAALGRPRELTFGIDRRGSRIVFIGGHEALD